MHSNNYIKYGKRTVNDVSIEVKQGEIVIFWPTGAGKTTTFYMTTGLCYMPTGEDFSQRWILPTSRFTNVLKAVSGYLASEAIFPENDGRR